MAQNLNVTSPESVEQMLADSARLLESIGKLSQVPNLGSWWGVYKLREDEQRRQAELDRIAREKAAEAQAKQQALSKLSPDERRLLGL
jgi:hypothetical protein